jgi:hypothetical protein
LGPGMGVVGGGFGTEKEKKKIFIKKHHFSIFTNYSWSTLGAFNV